MLDKIKLHFEFMEKDPYKNPPVIKINVKQVGIPVKIIVKTPHPKVFRKDKYGYYRLVSTRVRGLKPKKTKQKVTKKRFVRTAHA